MAIALTREQVLALAPDPASAKAASGLVADNKWVSLGADADAVWGECQGSGSKPYQAQFDLASLVSRCSCPSRKFPCKHGLALLLSYAQGNPRFAGAARPPWVDEWLSSRREKAAKKEQAATAAASTIDPEAAAAASAKREALRWKRIETGTAELERWIADQFRRGLAKFGPEQHKDGAAMAARMVDAQAPGLAPLLESALQALSEGGRHVQEASERFGLLQLLNEGVRRRASLSPARLADVRAALGWSIEKDEVIRTGDAVTDVWRVLGQSITERDAKLSERRVWLQGAGSGRHALLQEYAYGGKGWSGGWRNDTCSAATLRFFPGSVPLRAVALDVAPCAAPAPRAPAPVDDAIDHASRALAANPWLEQVPLVLDAVTPVLLADTWQLHTPSGALRMQLDAASAWSLLAFSGGHPVDVMGEWNGRALFPLSAWSRTSTWTRDVAA